MLCTRMAWSCLGALAVATWLAAAPAQAQDNYHMVGSPADNGEELTELRSDMSELHSNLKASAGTSYEQGPSCGCGVHAAPSCGCEVGCGCDMGCCDMGCCDTCCGCGGGCGGVYASAELMFFKYHRADGARVSNETRNPAGDDDVTFDFEATPRFTVGWVREDGLGVRARYWRFDHTAIKESAGEADSLSVNTYTFDGEVFDTFAVNCCWDLEVAAGIRYAHFREDMSEIAPGDEFTFRENHFNGWGGVASAEARRKVGCAGVLWVRSRTSILMDDKDVFVTHDGALYHDVKLKDTVCGMLELAFGYDYTMPTCNGGYYFARISAEWQNWYNFSSSFRTLDDARTRISPQYFDGPSDVGFGGFGFAVGMAR